VSSLSPLSKKIYEKYQQRWLIVFFSAEGLTADPFPSQSLKLAGGELFYRIRVGDYRIVYQVDTEEKQVVIQYIRHRRDVYRDL
jgi:mRNA-degrading endonuclease RelE of RelBE toxin-antitoxin system